MKIRITAAIAVHAKTSEPGGWSGAMAEDWVRLGAAVDEFKVMTYDYSGAWSVPGPIAPPGWMDAVVAHAESLVPAGKIMMGLPFYGYDWSNGTADSVLWSDVQATLTAYQPTLVRDDSGEATYTYTDGGGLNHTVFFKTGKPSRSRWRGCTGITRTSEASPSGSWRAKTRSSGMKSSPVLHYRARVHRSAIREPGPEASRGSSPRRIPGETDLCGHAGQGNDRLRQHADFH